MEGDNAAPGGTANTNTQANANVDATSGNRGTTPQVTVTASHERNAEMERISNIRAWGRDHAIEPERIQKWIGDGTSQLDASREINNILQERMAKPIETVKGPELSDKDQQRFSFARALMLNTPLQDECRQQPGGSKIDFGFERELLAEVQRNTAPSRNGNMLPFTLFARMLPQMQGRSGIDSATATTGGRSSSRSRATSSRSCGTRRRSCAPARRCSPASPAR
jgi:anti-sigma28 factor (negative regulator of flagellin synthesis)